MFHTRHFVLKICEAIRTGIWSNYLNTRILFGVQKNLNTEYWILFGIGKIRIRNTNTTIRSNSSNSIQIPNYLSHPGVWWISYENCRSLALTVWELLKSGMWHKIQDMWHVTHDSVVLSASNIPLENIKLFGYFQTCPSSVKIPRFCWN